jgi:hypothetical protein
MNLLNYFKPSRFGLLLKMELFRSRKAFFITFVVTFGLLFTGFILENVFSANKVFDSHAANYTFFLLVGGFILSSLAFNDLSNSLRRYNYLILPASTFEKFISMWLLTCAAWIIMFTLTYFVYALIANSIGHFFFKNVTFLAFDPTKIPVNSIGYYLVFQAILLVGAVHFKGYVLPKTIFTVLLFGIVCGIIFYFIMANIIRTADECPPGYNPLEEKTLSEIWQVVKWLVKWVMAPLSWVITYIGLKEQEV